MVYLTPSSQPGLQQLAATEVLGIYVEGDAMATDGQYTLRAPRMYYDVQFGRALVMDAVFWTYDENLGMPMYVRAKTLRQESSEQFKATGATISNTAFFEPHFSIGASSITIARNDRNESGWTADARHITLKAGVVPFFYWPIFKGDPRNIPLRAIELIGSSVSPAGIGIREVVMFALLQSVVGETELLVAIVLSRAITAGGDILFYLLAAVMKEE